MTKLEETNMTDQKDVAYEDLSPLQQAHAAIGWFGGWCHGMREEDQPSDETWLKMLREAHDAVDRIHAAMNEPSS